MFRTIGPPGRPRIPKGSIGSEELDRSLLRGYLAGLGLANNGTDGDHDIDIAVGVAMAADQSAFIELSSALTKRIDASWAVGTNQGGLDGSESVAGTPDADTWYHVWLIRRSDTGVVDALFSESATAPTMPTNYDQKRRLGAVLTNGSANANIIAFSQNGDEFLWDAPVTDINTTDPGTSAVLTAMTVPTGVKVRAINSWILDEGPANTRYLLVTSPDQDDTVPSATMHDLEVEPAVDAAQTNKITRTNTSAQLRYRLDASGASTIVIAVTYGWLDRRGRDD